LNHTVGGNTSIGSGRGKAQKKGDRGGTISSSVGTTNPALRTTISPNSKKRLEVRARGGAKIKQGGRGPQKEGSVVGAPSACQSGKNSSTSRWEKTLRKKDPWVDIRGKQDLTKRLDVAFAPALDAELVRTLRFG